MKTLKKIVVIGGGTGTYTVLSGLKKYPVDLTAVVSMADDGGSNRVIRDEFGLLPTSDIRQCLVALAEENGDSQQLLRHLFMYRFHRGKGIEGMTFGNLFIAALSDILKSQEEAIRKTSQILKIKGKILPVTLSNSRLAAVLENENRVEGEHFIDEPKHDGKLKIIKAFLKPEARANPEAIKAIEEADLVIIGPGDLYTSLIVNLLVGGIADALQKTKAKIVYVLNLMTKYGQTFGFSAKDHIAALEKYLGKNHLDFVLVNSKSFSRTALEKYGKENEISVVNDLKKDYFRIVKADLLSNRETKKIAGDALKRSLIRHDSQKLAKSIIRILDSRF